MRFPTFARAIVVGALSTLATSGAAFAADPEEEEDDAPKTSESTNAGELPPLTGEPRSADGYEKVEIKNYAEYKDLPLPLAAYQGAEQLNMDPEFVNAVQMGLEQLFKRDYNGARDTFEALEGTFPDTAVGAVVDTLIWQALMLENFDFKYDKQYWTSTKAARKKLELAMEKPGSEGWEHLLMATIVGIESIHTMRKSEYLKALSLAFDAMGEIEASKKANPDFIDLQLADGLYNYWRSAITLSNDALPDFGDERVKGIEQMQVVENRGVFLQPLATLSLAFTWIEEKDYKKAVVQTAKNRRKYPDSVINNLVAGTTFIYTKDYDSALKALAEVERVDPKNQRVKYWKGVALLRSGKAEEAMASFKSYLEYEHLEDYQKSWTLYRIGQCHARQKQWGEANESYQAAAKVDGHKPSKDAMERLKKRKKAGKIDF
jgi:tetratricopeptide (TPR) repeat protein